MRIGFSGTREGCTPAQGGALARYVRDTPMAVFRFGCCLGADTEAAAHVDYYQPDATILGHPSAIASMTSRVALDLCDDTAQPMPPLVRNRDIVEASDVLLACPKGMAEEQRSGTWATIRFARKVGKPVVIVWPDGTVTEEGG